MFKYVQKICQVQYLFVGKKLIFTNKKIQQTFSVSCCLKENENWIEKIKKNMSLNESVQ